MNLKGPADRDLSERGERSVAQSRPARPAVPWILLVGDPFAYVEVRPPSRPSRLGSTFSATSRAQVCGLPVPDPRKVLGGLDQRCNTYGS